MRRFRIASRRLATLASRRMGESAPAPTLTAILATAMLAASGCGLLPAEKQADTAPAPPPVPVPSAPPPPPPRPFELPLQNARPCDLLTPDQRSQLGFDRDPLPDTEAGFGDAPTCSFRNTTAKVGARLSLITTEGMDVWTTDTAQVQATPTTAADFPALVVKTPDLDRSCNVEVDVAQGQHLDVLYRDDGGRPPTPLGSLCDGARRVAESAVTSLRQPAPESTRPPTDQPPTDQRTADQSTSRAEERTNGAGGSSHSTKSTRRHHEPN